MVSPLFVNPGIWGVSVQDQISWRLRDAVRDGIVRIELQQIMRRYEMTEEQIIDFIIKDRTWEWFLEEWQKPGYEFTPFEAKIAERVFQGE